MYTFGLAEIYDMFARWRTHLDSFSSSDKYVNYIVIIMFFFSIYSLFCDLNIYNWLILNFRIIFLAD